MDEKIFWEYRVENFGNAWKNPRAEVIADELNQWGLAGWEVFSISHAPGGAVVVIAKRGLSDSSRRRHKMDYV